MRFYIGQNIEGKIVKEIFRDGQGKMITFTDGTWKIYK